MPHELLRDTHCMVIKATMPPTTRKKGSHKVPETLRAVIITI